MAGLTTDFMANCERDMYEFALESFDENPRIAPQIFYQDTDNTGLGNKQTEMLPPGRLTQATQENQSVTFETPTQSWSTQVEYQLFFSGMKFSKLAIERSEPSKIKNILTALAEAWGTIENYERETYAALIFDQGDATAGHDVFNGSFGTEIASSGDLPYDSVCFFNLSGNLRTTKGGNTYYNRDSSLSLSPSSFETLYNLVSVTNAVDERGKPQVNDPDTLLTRKGADMHMANRIINTEQGLPGGQQNDINPYYKLCTPISWRYLSDAAFYVGKRNNKKLQWVDAQPREIRFSRDELNFAYQATINVMWGIWVRAGAWRLWARGG